MKIEDELEIAEIFNEYFINKNCDLKQNIDQNYIEDPIPKLAKSMEGKSVEFSFTEVSEEKVKNLIRKMK